MSVAAWSYSRYAVYELCPLQFKLKHLDKIPTLTSAAMARGDKVHKGVANYLRAAAPLPAEVVKPFHIKLLGEVRAWDDKVVEEQWAFDRQWSPSGWFAKQTWFRSICDAAVLYEDMAAEALDWKTGKRYGSNDAQMETQAIAIFNHFKPAVHVTTRLVYFDAQDEEIAEFPRADLPKLQAKWERKVEPMFNDTAFLPRPNDKCRFCDFGKSKGGQCRFG